MQNFEQISAAPIYSHRKAVIQEKKWEKLDKIL